MSQIYALVLAGGSGERFWPLSRKARPKQLLSLFSGSTLLEDTLSRLDGFVPPSNILILTNADQEKGVREIASFLPAENIVAEPAKRDTAAAIALGVAWVAMRDPEATMIVLPADHLIQNREAFQETLRAAVEAAKTGSLVTIGIQPTWACPGFGYIEAGSKLSGEQSDSVFEVQSFREKPDAATAQKFLESGRFRWNAGMFIWSVPAIAEELRQHAPELAAFVEEVRETKAFARLLAEKFPGLPKISIDFAVMEKAKRVLMVEAGFDWDDVGSWTAVAKYFETDEAGNASNAPLTQLGARNNIAFAQKGTHVAFMGVSDLIVVQTGDAILVCHKNEAEKIKNLVGQVPKELQ